MFQKLKLGRKLGSLGRIAGKGLKSGFSEQGPGNYVDRVLSRKGVSGLDKAVGKGSRIAGQLTSSALHPMVLGPMALSYAPMMLQGNQGYDAVPATAPPASPQDPYGSTNQIPAQDPDAALLLRMQQEQQYYGGT